MSTVLCNKEIQTQFHMFWHCEKVKSFWLDFEFLVEMMYDIDNFHVTLNDIILGVTNANQEQVL